MGLPSHRDGAHHRLGDGIHHRDIEADLVDHVDPSRGRIDLNAVRPLTDGNCAGAPCGWPCPLQRPFRYRSSTRRLWSHPG